MSYYGDKEEYVPKFKVGDKVIHNRSERVRTVTGRKVQRRNRGCDTYYQLDSSASHALFDVDGAYESSLQPASELLAPGAVLARILPMFDAPAYELTVGLATFALVLQISGTRTVKLFADLNAGMVQTLGEWKWHVLKRNATAPNWSVQRGSAENLGGALVDASNTLHGHND